MSVLHIHSTDIDRARQEAFQAYGKSSEYLAALEGILDKATSKIRILEDAIADIHEKLERANVQQEIELELWWYRVLSKEATDEKK